MTGNPRTADDQLGNVHRAALRTSVNLYQLVHLSAFRMESTTRNRSRRPFALRVNHDPLGTPQGYRSRSWPSTGGRRAPRLPRPVGHSRLGRSLWTREPDHPADDQGILSIIAD